MTELNQCSWKITQLFAVIQPVHVMVLLLQPQEGIVDTATKCPTYHAAGNQVGPC